MRRNAHNTHAGAGPALVFMHNIFLLTNLMSGPIYARSIMGDFVYLISILIAAIIMYAHVYICWLHSLKIYVVLVINGVLLMVKISEI